MGCFGCNSSGHQTTACAGCKAAQMALGRDKSYLDVNQRALQVACTARVSQMKAQQLSSQQSEKHCLGSRCRMHDSSSEGRYRASLLDQQDSKVDSSSTDASDGTRAAKYRAAGHLFTGIQSSAAVQRLACIVMGFSQPKVPMH